MKLVTNMSVNTDVYIPFIELIQPECPHYCNANPPVLKRNRELIKQRPFDILSMTISMKEKSTGPIFLAIFHNNTATRYIEYGHYEGGIHELTAAMSLVKQAYLAFNRHQDYLSTRCTQQESKLETERCNCNHHERKYSGQINHLLHVSISPLRVRAETMNLCRDSYTRLSGIVMFNLAMATHLRAMQLQDQQSKSYFLRKSKDYYNAALSLHRKENGMVDAVRIMTKLNNLAHVHLLLENQNDADRHLKMLLSMIMYISVSSNATFDCSRVQLRKFVGNVTHLVLKCADSAAAA